MIDLGVDEVRAAAVAIDYHRGYLDPKVATMPAPADVAALLADNNRVFLARCWNASIPVIHLVTTYRAVTEIRSNLRWGSLPDDPASTRKNAERHNLDGSPGCEIMLELCDPARDPIIETKKLYDCFISTDLDFVLRARRINTLMITGINTNSCVLCTVAAANVRDYAPIVIEDCVDTMDGDDLHHAALACIRTALGWVMSADDALPQIVS